MQVSTFFYNMEWGGHCNLSRICLSSLGTLDIFPYKIFFRKELRKQYKQPYAQSSNFDQKNQKNKKKDGVMYS